MLDSFKSAGNALIKYTDGRPTDAVLREAVLGGVSKKAKSDWEASLASRPPLQRLPGEVPNYERRPEPVKYPGSSLAEGQHALHAGAGGFRSATLRRGTGHREAHLHGLGRARTRVGRRGARLSARSRERRRAGQGGHQNLRGHRRRRQGRQVHRSSPTN